MNTIEVIDNLQSVCVFQTSRYDCEDVWRHFEEAVVRRSPCNVTVEDYHQMFVALAQTSPPPCDRVRLRRVEVSPKHS